MLIFLMGETLKNFKHRLPNMVMFSKQRVYRGFLPLSTAVTVKRYLSWVSLSRGFLRKTFPLFGSIPKCPLEASSPNLYLETTKNSPSSGQINKKWRAKSKFKLEGPYEQAANAKVLISKEEDPLKSHLDCGQDLFCGHCSLDSKL